MAMTSASQHALVALAIFLANTFAGAATPPCATPVQADDGWGVVAPAAAGFDEKRLCEAMQAFDSSPWNLHGLVVERHGQLVAEHYRAGKDASTYTLIARTTHFEASTLHDVRSITKSVVSLLWGIAQADGTTPALQTPVLDLLPALADLKTDGRERITVQDLLRMRSGLAWDESGSYSNWRNDELAMLWRGDLARYVFDRPMAVPPGTRFNYNGGSTAVLGELLAGRAGMPLPEFARTRLFEPLGIRGWEWGRDLRGRPRAYAGLRMRPRDMAKLGRMVLHDGVWQGRQIVPASWLNASFTPQEPNPGYGDHWWLGVVWASGKSYVWRAGIGNGGQRLFMLPALDLVVVVTAGDYNDGKVGREALRLLSLVVGAVQESPGGTADSGPSSGRVDASPMPMESGQPAPEAAVAVETRAILRDVFEEDDGKRVYIRLKLAPRAKLPFTTLTFRVRDRALITGLATGDRVAFRAERVDGENNVIAIRTLPPCESHRNCQ
jgi:CubicO group peptidase (beta-lactamase class C family)/Cu/Ag efflux protein CusF